MSVLTNKRYKTYPSEFSFCPLGHGPGMGIWDAGGSKILVWGFAMAAHRLRTLALSFFLKILPGARFRALSAGVHCTLRVAG